jgi:sarcosine oxidase
LKRRYVGVVGAGVMGLSAAWALTRRGHKVAVFEQDKVGNEAGSSWGKARIFRTAHEERSWTRAAMRSKILWRRLEGEAGETLVEQTGGIDFGDRAPLRRVAATCSAEGVEYSVMPAIEAERHWPGVGFTDEVLYHSEAGVIHADAVLRSLRRLVEGAGGDLREGCRVISSRRAQRDGIEVVTQTGSEHFDAVVIAAGAWSPALCGSDLMSLSFEVTEEFPLDFELADAASLPVAIHHASFPLPAEGLYWLPVGERRVKIGAHQSGVPLVDPEVRNGSCPPRLAAAITHYAVSTFSNISPKPLSLKTGCLYTTTKTRRFVVRRTHDTVVLAGFSGEGFKFAPLIGELAADLVDASGDHGGLFP